MLVNFKQKVKSLIVAEPSGSNEFAQDWTSKIASVPGWLSRNEALLLWEMSRCVNPGNRIVEIGSYEGRSTVALALGSAGAQVQAVDPHTGDISEVEQGFVIDTWTKFQRNIARCGVSHVVVAVRDTSSSASKNYTGPPIELLFIDGWHSTEAVIADIEGWHKHLAPDASVVVDDWVYPPVAAGILKSSHLLPVIVGAVGKDLVFSNNLQVRNLAITRAAKRRARISNPIKIMGNLV